MHDYRQYRQEFSKIMRSVVILIVLLFFSSVSIAGSKIIPVEGISFTTNVSMMDNLSSLIGKKIVIILEGGETLSGILKSLGPHLIHVEKIEHKEFFDSLVRIDKIQAIEVQFRQYDR